LDDCEQENKKRQKITSNQVWTSRPEDSVWNCTINFSLPSITELVPSIQQQQQGVGNFFPIPSYIETCYLCATCKTSVQYPHFRDGKLYCSKHYVFQSGSDLYNLLIQCQPESHQIANYNVYPTPIISIDRGLNATETITACLIETTTNYQFQEGFQTGHIRVIKEGGNYLVLNGLKLNKMGRIKNELRLQQIMKYDTFVIRFRMAGQAWDSRPFKLVSSCTQLPKEVRSQVRPSKKPSFVNDNTVPQDTKIIDQHTKSLVLGNQIVTEISKPTKSFISEPSTSQNSYIKGPSSIQYILQ